MEQEGEKSGFRFLTFANDEEDAETKAKLQEAATRIEEAIAKKGALRELVDYKSPDVDSDVIDLANDSRPLYERLLEQQTKKQEAFEDSHRMSNLVSKLDEDDANYLNEVARNKLEEETRRRLEIQDILDEKKRLDGERERAEAEKSKLLFTTKSKSSDLKSKLSSIKVKPKAK